MIKTSVAAAALFAAHTLANPGSAIVVNKCSYDVHLCNTPSSGGGYSQIDQVLSSGGSYSQQWTELSNGNGWSIKLSKSDDMSNILQYEYTYHDDGTIWYDLSAVNGNPWDKDYEITSSGGCSPRQAAYRYSTDDAFGMQDCTDDSTITVTLCTGISADGGSGASSPPGSSPGTYSASPLPETSTKTHHHGHKHTTWGLQNKQVEGPGGDVEQSTPTTMATVADPGAGWHGPAVTVTNVRMATVTQYVTAVPHPKRHEHHAQHPHHKL